jgi:hypothetical protein
MEGTEIRARMRAGADLTDLDRGVDERLSDDVSRVPSSRGKRGPLEDGRTYASPLARRAAGPTSDIARDVVAERELIRAVMHRAHHRRACRRPLLTWLA